MLREVVELFALLKQVADVCSKNLGDNRQHAQILAMAFIVLYCKSLVIIFIVISCINVDIGSSAETLDMAFVKKKP